MSHAATHALFESEALQHQGAVYHFALRLCRNSAQAEDLTQETFLRALRGFQGFRFGTSVQSWLFKICKNVFIDGFRRQQRLPVLSLDQAGPEGASALVEATGTTPRPDADEGISDEVLRELADLPLAFREALLMCDVEGLSYEEIAARMNTPIGTVRSRISRARAQLAERLAVYAGDLGFRARPATEKDPEAA